MALRDLDIDVDVEVDGGELERANQQANDLIDTLEKLDKTYRIDIDLHAAPALAELERIERLTKDLDNETIDIIARFDDNSVIEQMTALRSLTDDETLKINVDIDDNAALERVSTLKHQLENEKLEMKLDLDITDAEGRLAILAAEMQAIEMNAINIDVDTAGAAAQIAVLHAQLLALQTTTFDINVSGADVAVLQAQIIALQAQLDSLGNNPPEIDVHTQATQAIAELSRIESRIHDLNAEDIFLNVDIDNLSSDILALRSQIHAIEASGINVNMDTAGAHTQLAVLQAHLQALEMQANGVKIGGGMASLFANFNPVGFIIGSVTFFGVLAAILAILPPLAVAINVAIGAVMALAVAIGVLGGAALALGSALAIGGAGLMGFGMLAISSITSLYEEKAKLNAQQLQLKAQTDKVADSWDRLKTTMQPTVLTATTNAVKAINTLLDVSEPILKKAGTATAGLMENLNKSLKGNEMQEFFSMVKKDIGPITTNIGNGLGNALKGVANTMTAFSPLTNSMSQGFENMMGRFSSWTKSLIGSSGMEAFADYIQRNFSKIGNGLLDGIKGVSKTIAGFSGISEEGFGWFESKMKQFNEWSSNLDTNSGFQNFLNSIKENAPYVGSILKNLGSSLKTFWTIMTDEGSGGTSRLESFANGLKNLSNALKDENLQNVISGAFTFDMSKIVSGLTGGLEGGGFGNAEQQIEKGVSTSIKTGLLNGIKNGMSNLTIGGLGTNIFSGLIEGIVGGNSNAKLLSDATINRMVDNTMSDINSALTGGGVAPQSNALTKGLDLFTVGGAPKMDVKVDADVTAAKSTLKSMSAEEIQAKVDADTATAQAKLDMLEATPIKISTDSSAIAANIQNMSATIALKADTSSISSQIQNMPGAKIKLTADTASLTNSIGSLPDAKITLKADKIDITNNIQVVDVPVNPILQQTSGLFGTTPTAVNVTPKFTEKPTIDDLSANVTLDYDQPKIDDVSANLTFNYEQPKIDDIQAKIQITADTGKLQVTFPKFNWPPMPKMSWPAFPKFSWPSLPKFTWPPMPKFSWPTLPKWVWPPLPKFSWPPFPKFSWPPMPTVKVSVSGGKVNGSHANGLGFVKHDGYVAELHRGESVLQAHNADLLRGMGILKGDGENPSLDMSAVANYQPAAASSNPKARVSSVNKSANDNSKKEYNITVNVDGSKNPEETATSITDHLQNWLASIEDANPQVYEY